MTGLHLAFLGPIQAQVSGRPAAFPTHKTLGLLIYLAVESGHAHRRESLAGMFWPDQPEETARSNLRKTLERLRRTLGDDEAAPDSPAPFLLVDAQTVHFNRASDHHLDVAEFNELLAASERHAHRRRESCQPCGEPLRRAAALYRGEFLAGFFLKDSPAFEEWVLVLRERFRRQAQAALESLSEYEEAVGDYDAARQLLERQIELDPWREEAHQRLMRLLARQGQRSAALAQYAACRRRLAQELGVDPSPETTTLFEQIRAGAALAEPTEVAERRARAQALPALPTPLVGREAELRALADRLSDPRHRLVTILGLGGTGKTHLALAAAHELAHGFRHGAAFISLAPLVSAEFLAPAILAGLGVPLQGQQDPAEAVLAYLRSRELLLVLDSCEHLLTSAASAPDDAASASPAHAAPVLLAAMLQQAPGVTLLATSRERLALRAEWVFELGGLHYPPRGAADLAGAGQWAAVRLFVQQAQQRGRPDVAEATEMPAVVRVCRLVEGLPLGLQLAVASLGNRLVAELAHELERGLAALATAPRDVPPRHRSMRAAFEHSWLLLTRDEQQLFPRLAVFQGGFDSPAAVAVAGATPAALSSLADKSLVRAGPAGRWGLHDLLRQFALEKLALAGEVAALRQQHLAYFTAWMEQAAPALEGAEQDAWLRRVAQEHDNLRAALQWVLDQGERALGVRLSGALWYFWYVQGHWREGRHWLESVLALRPASPEAEAAGDQARSTALDGLGVLAWRQGHLDSAMTAFDDALALKRALADRPGQARVLAHRALVLESQGRLGAAQSALEESLALSRKLGDQPGAARALHNLGNLAVRLQEPERAARLYEECLTLYRQLGDKSGIALLNLGLGTVARQRADHAQARAYYEQSLAFSREVGDPWNEAVALRDLGMMAFELGDYAQASGRLQQSLDLLQTLDDQEGVAVALADLGRVSQAEGDLAKAAHLLKESLRRRRTLGNHAELADSLERLAALARSQARLEQAVRLASAAALLRETLRGPPPLEQPVTDRAWMDGLKNELGEAAFRQGWDEAQQWPLEKAVEEALAL